jgi:hypothetical protein
VHAFESSVVKEDCTRETASAGFLEAAYRWPIARQIVRQERNVIISLVLPTTSRRSTYLLAILEARLHAVFPTPLLTS